MAERSLPPGKTIPKAPNRTTQAASQHNLYDDVTTALKALGVALAPTTLDAALQAAEQDSLSHLEFLHRLLAEPAAARRQRALDRRLRKAKFRELTTLEGFDWAFNAKGVDRRAELTITHNIEAQGAEANYFLRAVGKDLKAPAYLAMDDKELRYGH